MRAPEFWSGKSTSARLVAAALTPAGWLHGAATAFKAATAKPYRSKAKIVCVGNPTAGGTGKTPVAIAIARMLTERGHKVCLLTRGYGGSMRGPILVDPNANGAWETGDEALLLAAAAPTIVSRDRAAGARLAESNGADVIVMDDGHQNFSLAKDLSLVVVDSDVGFGNGRILPAGPLREPVARSLARADAIVVVGETNFALPVRGKPVLRARLVPDTAMEWSAQRVVAFAGIGRPEKFFHTLRELGTEVAAAHAFADHHVYTDAELAKLRSEARTHSATLVTTEKDFVRLKSAQRQDIASVPVRAIFDDPSALATLLDRVTPQITDDA